MQEPLNNQTKILVLEQVISDAECMAIFADKYFGELIEQIKKDDCHPNEFNWMEFFKKFNADLALIESDNNNASIIKKLKKAGLYHILYSKGLYKHQQDKNLLYYTKSGFIGVGISSLFVTLFAVTAFVTVPFWLHVIAIALFAAAVTYMSALLYGILNDIYAVRMNFSYFLLGHQGDQHSILPTNDKLANACAWGVLATHSLAMIAAAIFAIAIGITAIILVSRHHGRHP